MTIAAVLVAAGSGSRFGAETPKQFLPLAGRAVIRHAAEALAREVDLVQPVGEAAPILAALRGTACLPPVPGGATRQASVRAGLEALVPYAPDIVLVHDAARPLIPPGTIPALLAALERAPGAIPAVPVADTLKRGSDGRIVETVPRAGLFRAQTPQAFRFAALLAAHRARASGSTTDDASLLEAARPDRAAGSRRRGQHQADLSRGPATAGACDERIHPGARGPARASTSTPSATSGP